MERDDLLSVNIICLDIEAESSEDAIKKLGQMLVENSYIKPSYVNNVILREKIFPTGLILDTMGIAIPHATPSDDVLKDGIAVTRLKKPVGFYCMEDPEKKIDVSMIFMLSLCGNNKHLGILKKLFSIFRNRELVELLQDSKDKNDFLQLLSKNLNIKGEI
ncbi:PTS sugar transporter subunit IIA [Pectinatus frisingensis]|uniref:PTS sugar transporter subunit IIA n=1 Tax=Pectinatus frisingensis TaxID=865 RepID=UPI0018C47C20|nr:PTS sugar transporter subunit IIA [Pectinatus frisingensis]